MSEKVRMVIDMSLTQAELIEIKERSEKATSGPWQVASTTDGEYILDCDEWVVAATFERREDAYFVAHAREDIPKLVAEVERLREAIIEAIADIDAISPHEAKKTLREALNNGEN